MRFAYSGGKYGAGNYFAVHSSYSASSNFVHTRQDGMKSILYNYVLIGRSANDFDRTGNRNKPPMYDEKDRYDSVTDGS